MKLTDLARHLPEEVGHLFAPLLPPVVWCGNGRPPARNDDGLQAVCSGLGSGRAAAHRRPGLHNRPPPLAGLAPGRALSHRGATARAPL